MRKSHPTWHWITGSVMIVVFLGFPLIAGAGLDSDFFQKINKVRYKAKVRLPQGEATVKYKTWMTFTGAEQKKLVCEVDVVGGLGTNPGDPFLCQVEVGGNFVTLAEWQVFPDKDGDVEGKVVRQNEQIPADQAASLVDGAKIQVVVNSASSLTFRGVLQEIGKKHVELKAKMGKSPMGKGKVKYESRVKTDGSSNRKLTCKVELDFPNSVKPEDRWSCYTVIDGARNDLGVLQWKIDDGDDLEGKVELRTPTDSIPEIVAGTPVFIGQQGTDQVMFQGILYRD